MQQTQKRVLAEIWERRNPDIRSGPRTTDHAGVDHRKGKPASRRAQPGCVSIRQPTAAEIKAAVGSRPSSTGWSAAREPWVGRSSVPKFSSRRPIILCIEGLPPGPIANPGCLAEAAAIPARTRDLFFVADGTGGHAFTETYDQHQKNVVKLRTMEKADSERHGRTDRPIRRWRPRVDGAPTGGQGRRPKKPAGSAALRSPGRAVDGAPPGFSNNARMQAHAGTEFHIGRSRTR